MRNLSVHIVYHEWFSEVEFVVREWHCLEVKCHCGTALNISKLIASGSCVAISIEELRHVRPVFREVRVIEAFFPLLIVVHDVVSLWSKQFSDLFVLENLIKYPDLVNCWLSTLVSNTRSSHQGKEGEMQFPEWSL